MLWTTQLRQWAFRRPYFLGPWASDLRGFVKQPSFDSFYQHRPTMAPQSANNGTNLAQGAVKGTRKSTKIKKNENNVF